MRKHPEIVLTSPATEMSDHHRREFLGFGTCSPTPPFPRWLVKLLFYPTIENQKGVARFAPYGLRKVEASLLESGFGEDQVLVVHPDFVNHFVGPATKAVGVSVMDPLGLGPVSATFGSILGGEPATAHQFMKLMRTSSIRKHRPKIIVGGPGAWQIQMVGAKKFGISTLVIGEADEVAPKLFWRAVRGEELPELVEIKSPGIDAIPSIRKPSVNGLVEISRGCGRNCQFCVPTMRSRRDFSSDKILDEVITNVRGGCREVCLHAEDILLYGSGSQYQFKPCRDRVLTLFRKVLQSTGGKVRIGVSHVSLPAVTSSPRLVEDLSDLLDVGTSHMPFLGVQIGLETGSSRLIRKYMAGKPLPYRPEEWREVVETALGILHDNKWIPAMTLLVGLPDEKTEDVIETIDLLDDLKRYRSLIVPLYFISNMEMILHVKNSFNRQCLTPEHEELFAKCLAHSLHWANQIRDAYFGSDSSSIIKLAFSTFMNLIGIRSRAILRDIQRNINQNVKAKTTDRRVEYQTIQVRS